MDIIHWMNVLDLAKKQVLSLIRKFVPLLVPLTFSFFFKKPTVPFSSRVKRNAKKGEKENRHIAHLNL